MYEIDKAAFGAFVAGQRKAKGYTQKELAQKLFVSDKAVSKWERALSLPDISLLVPLAELLDVSVAELLEGRRLTPDAKLSSECVDVIVQKALTFSEDTPERQREKRKKHAAILGSCTFLAALELLLLFHTLSGADKEPFISFFVLEGLGFGFGVYLWLFIRERLPSYYDENKISAYSDGIFRMNMVGLCFNNRNWPHILRVLRLWSAVTVVTVPLAALLTVRFAPEADLFFTQPAALAVYLIGLFLPVYLVGKKYE